jgi:hypothetical protein
VKHFLDSNNVDVAAILEIRLKSTSIGFLMQTRFNGWNYSHNLLKIRGGCILLLWKEDKVDLNIISMDAQIINVSIICRITSLIYLTSFVYGLHSIANQKTLWESLLFFWGNTSQPWLILGDFNSITHSRDRCNGIMDRFFPRIDRVFINGAWLEGMQECMADFLPSGCLSDHSPCIVSFLDYSINKRYPFKFFNMWADHDSFLEVVREAWDMDIYGSDQFAVCRKLKLLKGPLQRLNAKHFSHLSTRATKAKEELDVALMSLHDDPTNLVLQDQVRALRASCWKLGSAERNFYVQKAKCKYLVDGDRRTKFFHDLVKRNRKRNYIAAIVKEDGSRSSSPMEVGEAFVHYYRVLLCNTLARHVSLNWVWACRPVQ